MKRSLTVQLLLVLSAFGFLACGYVLVVKKLEGLVISPFKPEVPEPQVSPPVLNRQPSNEKAEALPTPTQPPTQPPTPVVAIPMVPPPEIQSHPEPANQTQQANQSSGAFKKFLGDVNFRVSFPEWWLKLGIGASYNYFRQQTTGYQTGTLTSLNIPEWSVDTGGFFTDKSGFDLTYKQVPGSLTTSANGQRSTKTYQWKTISVEFLRSQKQSFRFWGYDDELIWRLGFQHHELFTIIPVQPNSALIDVLPTSITNASLGLEYKLITHKKGRSELMLRYQHPFSAAANTFGDSFSVKPKFSFDGSIGYIYKVNDTFSLGSYWFGQWQFFNYSYLQDNNSYSGYQQFFNSSIDIRFGIEF